MHVPASRKDLKEDGELVHASICADSTATVELECKLTVQPGEHVRRIIAGYLRYRYLAIAYCLN